MPNYSYWKITWQTDLAHWLDYNLLKDIKKNIKQEVRLFKDKKTMLYLYLKTATNKSKLTTIFTRAESIQESNKIEFEEARNVYFSGKKKRDEIYNLEGNLEKAVDASTEREERNRPPLTEINTPIRLKKEELSPFSLKKKVKVEVNSPSINVSTTNSSEEDKSKSLSSILLTPPEPKENLKELARDLTKEDIVLRILNGDSMANIINWCKTTKNVRLFILVHENIKEFQSMENLIKTLEYDGSHKGLPSTKLFVDFD